MLKIGSSLEGKMTFGFINDMRVLVNFTRAIKSLKIYTLMGPFCRKYEMFELKSTQELCREKWLYGSKMTKNLVNFYTCS